MASFDAVQCAASKAQSRAQWLCDELVMVMRGDAVVRPYCVERAEHYLAQLTESVAEMRVGLDAADKPAEAEAA